MEMIDGDPSGFGRFGTEIRLISDERAAGFVASRRALAFEVRESRLDDCSETANAFLNLGRCRLSEREAEVIRLGRTTIERFARAEDDPRFSGLQKELTGIDSGR